MLLSVRDLETHFVTRDLDNRIRVAHALNGVSFDVDEGHILGLVGETGAGKSLTVTSILGLLRAPARVVGGTANFAGQDLLQMQPQELAALLGTRISLVVQSPRTSLDPLSRIGDQLIRLQRAHRRISHSDAAERAEGVLRAVGIPDPSARMRAWPHELSGGMAQRVIIALALVNGPRLLIADEPTTGLDVTVQAQILDLLSTEVRQRHIGAIIITHDLGVIAQYCDDVAVMFAGQIVEQGTVGNVFAAPAHPYTRILLAATPERLRLGTAIRSTVPPDLYALPTGCLYRQRCPDATDACGNAPPVVGVSGHLARCHYARFDRQAA